MAEVSSHAAVGPLLREWRKRRRRSQLDVALDAGISARHLSFVETGRSKPGRELLLRILAELDVPLREQNQLLLSAGYAPAFPQRSLDDPDLAPVRAALDAVLREHEPYPAIAVDRGWNLVAANSAVLALTERVRVDPALLEPPVNALRISLHPRGLAPLIVNLADWHAHFHHRLERQAAASGDRGLAALLDEIAGYPQFERVLAPARADGGPIGPLKLRGPDGSELSFLGMFAAFDTPFEVTVSELAVELLFPADRATADTLTALAARRA
jgi:transcriptional regulator with XRE-family HTH domain